jgi:hypothetical protein
MRRFLARIVIFVFRLFRVQCFAEMETPGGWVFRCCRRVGHTGLHRGWFGDTWGVGEDGKPVAFRASGEEVKCEWI